MKAGVNNVNKDIINDLLPKCGQLVVELFDESFRSGQFREVLKFTIVTPIPKIKDRSTPRACDR